MQAGRRVFSRFGCFFYNNKKTLKIRLPLPLQTPLKSEKNSWKVFKKASLRKNSFYLLAINLMDLSLVRILLMASLNTIAAEFDPSHLFLMFGFQEV